MLELGKWREVIFWRVGNAREEEEEDGEDQILRNELSYTFHC
jgi:hypothetical protein